MKYSQEDEMDVFDLSDIPEKQFVLMIEMMHHLSSVDRKMLQCLSGEEHFEMILVRLRNVFRSKCSRMDILMSSLNVSRLFCILTLDFFPIPTHVANIH